MASLPPGPRWPAALSTIAYWTWPIPLLRHLRARYGPAFTLTVAPPGRGVWLTDAADIKTVFTLDPSLVDAGEANELLAPVLGRRSVLLSDGEKHMRRRRLMLPMFHGPAIAAYRELMTAATREEVARWRPGVMRLHPRMRALTLEIILRAVLGVEASDAAADLRRALREVLRIDGLRMLLWVRPELARFGPWRRYRSVQAEADALLADQISACRAAPDLAERTDVLALLVRARYEDGSALEDDDIRSQLLTLLLAGHETTATGLAWAFERLMRHPEHMRRAVAAADAGDEDALERVAKEALRVRPVIVDVARVLTADVELAGGVLPKGTKVFPVVAAVQESDDWGPHPRRFEPDRWIDRQPPPYSWIPFGGGVRRCLGAAFAQMEMRIVLSEVLRSIELRPLIPIGEPQKVRHITNVPAFGALARVRERRLVSRGALPR